jgi:ParB-like chromosome segregation protein Spo0J
MSTPTIETIALADLCEPKTNPNVMETRDAELLERAIRQVGFLQPILVRELPDGHREIVDGVHRVRAAKKAGLAKVPCVVVSDFDDSLATAMQVGMNRMRGELDLSRVAQSLSSLANEGWSIPDMALTGFGEDEIAALLKSTANLSEEEIMTGNAEPELEDAPKEELENTTLEIEFVTKKEMQAAKRKLKKIAGKGNPLGNAIIQLLEGTCE